MVRGGNWLYGLLILVVEIHFELAKNFEQKSKSPSRKVKQVNTGSLDISPKHFKCDDSWLSSDVLMESFFVIS